MLTEQIKFLIEKHLPQSTVMVEGEDGQHFQATIICADFSEKNLLTRQRMVYQALGEHIKDGTIHALSLKTYTFQEWEALNHE